MHRRTIHALVSAFTSLTAQSASITQGPTDWTTCPSGYPDIMRCSTVTVPLDYHDLEGKTIDLTLLKLPAHNTTARQGSIIWQFGGPGEPTSNTLITSAQIEDLLLGEVQLYFDVIAVDPRGVGMNHPVKCDPSFGWQTLPYFPRTEDEYRQSMELFEAYGQTCLERTGEVMHHMDTRTQAMDLEIVRQAIGEGPLNYYGLSWGTMRGFDYAVMYPDSVGKMVLDAVVDHSLTTVELASSSIHSSSLTLRRMLEWMRDNSTSALYGRDTIRIWRELIKRADQSPISAPDCAESGACFAETTGDDLRIAIYTPLCHPNVLWPGTSMSIQEAYDNQNSSAMSYPILDEETGVTNSMLGIICHDWEYTESWKDYSHFSYMTGISAWDPAAPIPSRLWGLGCPRWPVNVTNPPNDLRVENSEASMPIMLVHSLVDPAVGYDQAMGVHKRISKSVLLTRYGEGHGSMEWANARQAMMDYFVRGMVPDPAQVVDQPLSETVTDFEVME